MRVLQQAQLRVEVAGPGGEVERDCVPLGGETLPLSLQLEQAAFDLPGGDGTVGGEVEEVLFLVVEGCELVVELLLQEALGFVTSIGATASGTTRVIPANVRYLRVELYQPDASDAYASFAQAFANGTLVPSVTRNE